MNLTNQGYIMILKYWLKILESNDRKFIRVAYNLMLIDIETRPAKKNWASCVKDILSRFGFHEVWIAQSVGDKSKFLSLFKQRVKDNLIQGMESRLNDSSRAVFFRSFSKFELQSYLNNVNIQKYRVAMTRLRLSSHRLHIETGRWSNTSSQRR